jgi:hypothetical protein
MESNREFSNSKVTEHSINKTEVGSSFIKDGFEIHIESVYIVNGKKKRKVKKKRINRGELFVANPIIEPEQEAIKRLEEKIVPKLVIPKSMVTLQPSSSKPKLLTKSAVELQPMDTARSAFRDPDLCLVTSARLLTIQ